MSACIPISAVLPAYDRIEATRSTVAKIAACDPPPAEILVHLDGGKDFPIPGATRIIHSETNIGPGGGRNRLIENAKFAHVASFDDDSFPKSPDFFQKASETITALPGYAIYALDVQHPDPKHDCPLPGGANTPHETTIFNGGGCIFERAQFLATDGYLALPSAYGMEEVDLALRLTATGGKILTVPGIPVYHDADLLHHNTPRIAASALANQALLAFLRYPASSVPIGIAQYANKALDQLRRGRLHGTILGIAKTPGHLFRFAKHRNPVSSEALARFRELTRNPRPITTTSHGQ